MTSYLNQEMKMFDKQISDHIKKMNCKKIIAVVSIVVIVLAIVAFIIYNKRYCASMLGFKATNWVYYRMNNKFSVLPKYFDYNRKYLAQTFNQLKCGSCYIISTCNMLTDRMSLCTYGALQVPLSYQYLLCIDSGSTDDPCGGGNPEDVLRFIQKNGAILEKYMPYRQKNKVVDNTKCFIDKNKYDEAIMESKKVFVEPGSVKELCNSGTTLTIGSSTHLKNIERMKWELVNHGPIVGTIYVYDDLYKYKKGEVYKKMPTAKFLYGHAVIIVSWKDDGEGIPYWVVHNSWSTTFGDKGYIKVRMYTNEVMIESRASSANPMVSDDFVKLHTKNKISDEPLFTFY